MSYNKCNGSLSYLQWSTPAVLSRDKWTNIQILLTNAIFFMFSRYPHFSASSNKTRYKTEQFRLMLSILLLHSVALYCSEGRTTAASHIQHIFSALKKNTIASWELQEMNEKRWPGDYKTHKPVRGGGIVAIGQ